MNSIRPAQFAQWLQEVQTQMPDATPVVLDVREPWELQTASVQADGFQLIHMPMRSVPAHFAALETAQPIACLCHHGARSAQVAQFLIEHGFSNVVNIHGGIHAWSQERDPNVPTY